jgi:hypothetical protein
VSYTERIIAQFPLNLRENQIKAKNTKKSPEEKIIDFSVLELI